MANIHILSMDGTEFTAAFHIAIPATNNAAGVPWRTVVLRNRGGTTILPDGDGLLGTISAAEKAQIIAGAVVEVVKSGGWSSAFPSGAQLDALHASVQSDYTSNMQSKFNRYGMTR